MNRPLELVADRLYALPMAFDLDRPRSMFPADASGFGTVNCYLLKDGGSALLVDTGFPAFRDDVRALLDTTIEPSTTLSIVVLRPAEISALGNLFTILEQRDVDVLYGALASQIIHSFDPRALSERSASEGSERHYEQLGRDQTVELAAGRPVRIFTPVLHMLNQHWMYDEETQTMFTSEYFGHLWSEHAAGPWTLDDPAADRTDVDTVVRFLRASNRTWWLAGADGETLATWLETTFAQQPVRCIAPAFGAIIRGTDTVARHVELLAGALRRLGHEPLMVPGSRALAPPRPARRVTGAAT